MEGVVPGWLFHVVSRRYAWSEASQSTPLPTNGSASSRSRGSPVASLSNSLRALLPWISPTTDASFTFAPSSTFCSWLNSRLHSSVRLLRYRVSFRCSRLGIKLAFIRPCYSSSAIHSASFASVFRPGTAFRCAAFTTITSVLSARTGCTAVSSTPRVLHRRHLTAGLFQPFAQFPSRRTLQIAHFAMRP